MTEEAEEDCDVDDLLLESQQKDDSHNSCLIEANTVNEDYECFN